MNVFMQNLKEYLILNQFEQISTTFLQMDKNIFYNQQLFLDNFLQRLLFTETVWLHSGFGLEKAIGHADFYPNGGEKQPGCDRDVGTHLFNLITGKIESKCFFF